MPDYSLVIFQDSILHICKKSAVSLRNGKTTAPFKGSRFECTVIANGNFYDMQLKLRSLKGTVDWADYSDLVPKVNLDMRAKCKRILCFDEPAKLSECVPSTSTTTTDPHIVFDSSPKKSQNALASMTLEQSVEHLPSETLPSKSVLCFEEPLPPSEQEQRVASADYQSLSTPMALQSSVENVRRERHSKSSEQSKSVYSELLREPQQLPTILTLESSVENLPFDAPLVTSSEQAKSGHSESLTEPQQLPTILTELSVENLPLDAPSITSEQSQLSAKIINDSMFKDLQECYLGLKMLKQNCKPPVNYMADESLQIEDHNISSDGSEVLVSKRTLTPTSSNYLKDSGVQMSKTPVSSNYLDAELEPLANLDDSKVQLSQRVKTHISSNYSDDDLEPLAKLAEKARPSVIQSTKKPAAKILCNILMQDKEVNLIVLSMLHKGFYKCGFQQFPTHAVAVLSSHNAECPEKRCEPNVIRTPCTITKTEDELHLAVQCCITEGVLKGVEIPVPGTGNIVIPLTRSPGDGVKNKNVRLASTTSEGLYRNRQHNCLYCNKVITCFGRHVRMVHKDEPEVIQIARMKPGSEERNKAIETLRLAGDKQFNLKCKPEDRLLVRKATNPEKSVCCIQCGGMFGRKNFSRHDRFCRQRSANGTRAVRQANIIFRLEQREVAKENAVSGSNDEQDVASITGENLLEFMRDDDTLNVIRADTVLSGFASDLAKRYINNLPEAHNAKQNLRLCARLLKQLRGAPPYIETFSEALTVQHYDDIIRAIAHVCKLNEKNQSKRPGSALLFGMLLTKLAKVLQSQYMHKGRTSHQQELRSIKDFIMYHRFKYNTMISKQARKLLIERRVYEKPLELPSPQDAALYGNYIKEHAKIAYDNLIKNGFHFHWWRLLGQCTMLELMFFNRRRVGEISKALLAAFEARSSVPEHDRPYMDATQTKLADSLQVMKIVGKRDRQLAILMPNNFVKYLELFVHMRDQANITKDNKYLFPMPQGNGHFQASSIIRQISVKCGASKPHTLRGTLLRKQVATLTQLITMDDNDIQQLADFMGHDASVHKSVYRTPSALLQITKLSRIFMAMEAGDLQKFRGKTIDEIELELGDKIKEIEMKDSDVVISANKYKCDWDDEEEENLEIAQNMQSSYDFAEKSKVTTEDDAIPDGTLINGTPKGSQRKRNKTTHQLMYETALPKTPRRLRRRNIGSRVRIDQTPDAKSTTIYQTPTSAGKLTSPLSAQSTPSSFASIPAKQTSQRKFARLRSPKTKTTKQLVYDSYYPKPRGKLSWRDDEKRLIRKLFADCFKFPSKNPSIDDCRSVAEKYPTELRHRNAQAINVWIREEKKRVLKREQTNII